MSISPFFKLMKKYLAHSPVILLLLSFGLTATILPVKAQFSKVEQAQAQQETQAPLLQAQAEKFVNLLGKEKYTEAIALLHPNLQSQWNSQKLEKIWQDLLAQTGPFQKIVSSRVVNTIDGDLIVVKVQFEKVTDEFLVVFNQNEQITGVDFPNQENIQQIAEKFVDALGANDFARARGFLHPSLKTEIFPQQMEQRWINLQKQVGRFKKRLDSEVKPASSTNELNLVLVNVEFEKLTEDLIIIFDNNKRVVGIDFPISEVTN